MEPFTIGILAFFVIFGAALLGMFVKNRLPEHHLTPDSRDAIKLATAIIGTLSALALGLLIASAKRSFDDAGAELRTTAARILVLDRVLDHYGPETAEMRQLLRKLVEQRRLVIDSSILNGDSLNDGLDVEPIQDRLRDLVPNTDGQRWLQSRALQLTGQVAETRWSRPETEAGGFPSVFIVFIVFWLALLFVSFGLLTPGNATVTVFLLVSAISVAGALVLIIDMDHPYLGYIRVSDAPLRLVLERLGRP
ncbi:bestrophin-like domain [Bosea sp. TAF32]|uniref:bestrophin-like domain n=1 Tax=Bosea sp. TAF32 TaxID=3237482 RepID=UPI003F93464E